MIPLKLERTFEDFSITDPDERNRIFGHPEHVRLYGNDFIDRMTESGFNCQKLAINDIVSEEEATVMALNTKASLGLSSGNSIFHCTKPIH